MSEEVLYHAFAFMVWRSILHVRRLGELAALFRDARLLDTDKFPTPLLVYTAFKISSKKRGS